MRLAGRVRSFVGVSVMDVVHMRMRMNESLVKMLMLVMFGQVQPYADGHQGTRDKKLRGYRFTKHNDRYRAANERCCGKVCTSTREDGRLDSQRGVQGIATPKDHCPLLGVRRTFPQLTSMSASDPKRTFIALMMVSRNNTH
jgi:hypothetical protein